MPSEITISPKSLRHYSVAVAIITEQSQGAVIQCPIVALQAVGSHTVLCHVPLEVGNAIASEKFSSWQEQVYLCCSFKE